MLIKKYECPCCGYLTLPRKPSGTYDLCPVCFWEDDGVQFENPFYEGGANSISLNEARQNFLKFGAYREKAISFVRKPLPEEIPLTNNNNLH